MATFKKFEEIEAWQKARGLSRQVYQVSNRGGLAKDFGLRDQMRRASVATLSSIAEGFERDGTGEFGQFLSIAKGSIGELRAQLYVALDQGYVSQEVFETLHALATETSRLISGLMGYLRRSGMRGVKYKDASIARDAAPRPYEELGT